MSALRHRGWALGWHSWGWVLGLGIQRGGGVCASSLELALGPWAGMGGLGPGAGYGGGARGWTGATALGLEV